MVMGWIKSPRTAKWFDDPNYDEELRDHLGDDRIDQWVVMRGDVPLAYLQDYRIHGWENHPLGFLPAGSRGMDTCIGTEADMAQGLGPAYLRLHANRLFSCGVPALGIDPHPENAAAIRAYQKVGFSGDTEVTTEWGRMRLMTLWPK
jgi:aminoglycoside 6'-N-acetyltransferase